MCIVVDVDGTLVKWSQQQPNWDAYKHEEDTPIVPVVSLISDLSKRETIVILTARPEFCRDQTERLMRTHGIVYDSVVMRKDIMQSGVDFKELAIFEIQKKYGQVKFVVDDDPENVRMFVKHGFFVLDVGCNFRV